MDVGTDFDPFLPFTPCFSVWFFVLLLGGVILNCCYENILISSWGPLGLFVFLLALLSLCSINLSIVMVCICLAQGMALLEDIALL